MMSDKDKATKVKEQKKAKKEAEKRRKKELKEKKKHSLTSLSRGVWLQTSRVRPLPVQALVSGPPPAWGRLGPEVRATNFKIKPPPA